ncbi:MAG: glycoside hydrolase family 2 TIM barrel-domain containing protein, partial [Massilia sp.]
LLAASHCLGGALAAPVAAPASAPSSAPRVVQQFNDGWRFHKGDVAGAEQPGYDASGWRSLSVPHDWSIEGPVDQANPSGPAGGFFPGGVGWYRKTITLPRLEAGRRSFIVFDGVMANSDVWINGAQLGNRPSGYSSFVYELTAHLKAGENVIAVRCDNANEPKLRWYLGAGIYRQVRLVTTADTHIEPWGTFVTTPAVSGERATVHVRSTLQSPGGGTYALAVSLVGPDGKVAASFNGKPVTLKAGASADLDAETVLAKPDRWDIDHPAMYTARVRVTGAGKAVDNEDVPFGIRAFEFNPAKGFFLNGRALKIYGVGLHVDAGALGAAVPLSAWERRLVALRGLGVNAIRTAHNAVAPEFLDLCDRLGFLVMDEFFDQWTLEKVPYDYARYFKEWSERDVRDLVRRDRNHPGIIIYSAGNEIRDTTRPELATGVLKSLIATYHANDPTRPVTQALFRPNVSKDYDNGYADLLDLVGQNYREKEILAAWAQKPTRKIIGTENTHELSQWAAVRDHPEYSGQFLWTGVDYLGEAGKWPTIGTGSGLLLTTGVTRPRAFERQAWWTTAPMVRMARRVAAGNRGVLEPVFAAPGAKPVQEAQAAPGAPARFAQPLLADWTPASLAPHSETVEIYTNADEVELSLNGESLGTAPRNQSGAPVTFKVPFVPGVLKAVARSAGKVVASDELRTAGKPARLLLTTDQPNQKLGKDVDAVAYLSATLVDEAGTTVPDSDTQVSFAASGPGAIIAVDNGNLLDHDPFQATRRKLYNGQAVAIVRASADQGRITVTASAPGVAPASATIEATPGTPLAPFRSF